MYKKYKFVNSNWGFKWVDIPLLLSIVILIKNNNGEIF